MRCTSYESPNQCHHCGMWHDGTCPRIKSIEYHQNGTVKKIEYHDRKETEYSWPVPKNQPVVYNSDATGVSIQ